MTETIAVQRAEYVFGAEADQLVHTSDALVHVRPDESVDAGDRIAATDITTVRTAVDRSVTGFHTIGVALGLVAALFTGVGALLFANGAGINVVSAGTVLCAAIGWLAAVQYYRADRGSLRVLAVDTIDRELVFYTQADGETVGRIADGLREEARATAEVRTAPST